MGELFFVGKCFFVTLIIVLVLQIQIGESTLEEKATMGIGQSVVMKPIQQVAESGVILVRNAWNKVIAATSSKFRKGISGESAPGLRKVGIDMSRSKAFIEEQKKRLSDATEAGISKYKQNEAISKLKSSPSDNEEDYIE